MGGGGAIHGHLHRHFGAGAPAKPVHADPVAAQCFAKRCKHGGVGTYIIRIQLAADRLVDNRLGHRTLDLTHHDLQPQGLLRAAAGPGMGVKHVGQVAVETPQFVGVYRKQQIPTGRGRNIVDLAADAMFDGVIGAADPEDDFDITVLRPAPLKGEAYGRVDIRLDMATLVLVYRRRRPPDDLPHDLQIEFFGRLLHRAILIQGMHARAAFGNRAHQRVGNLKGIKACSTEFFGVRIRDRIAFTVQAGPDQRHVGIGASLLGEDPKGHFHIPTAQFREVDFRTGVWKLQPRRFGAHLIEVHINQRHRRPARPLLRQIAARVPHLVSHARKPVIARGADSGVVDGQGDVTAHFAGLDPVLNHLRAPGQSDQVISAHV
ncbi:hypothetical protein SRABI110_06077 [Pseudomonas carnis]|nr:hypothetical protein SRABI110_06077 [Pseudomonas carnis]